MFVKYKDGNKLNTLTSHSDNKYRLCTEPYTFLIITIFRRHAAPLFVPISPQAQTIFRRHAAPLFVPISPQAQTCNHE